MPFQKMNNPPIFVELVEFHFSFVPKKIIAVWKNYLWFGLHYFSVGSILKTLFSPWKRIAWAYPRGFNLGAIFETLVGNLVSRIIGLIVRLFFLSLAFVFEFCVFLIGLIVLIFWLFWPFVFLLAKYYV